MTRLWFRGRRKVLTKFTRSPTQLNSVNSKVRLDATEPIWPYSPRAVQPCHLKLHDDAKVPRGAVARPAPDIAYFRTKFVGLCIMVTSRSST